ncbi:MAG TPA: BON domain-containing protein [Pyrinomonadaceae bacterium]|nr:BON domain-containing protein [Pyrinomonadaceae bacterium]
MAYDEEQVKRSRVVIETTPEARREVVRTVVAREPVRRGIPGSLVAVLVIGSVALVTLLFLFILNRQQDAVTEVNANVRATSAPTPAQQPVIIEQAPTTTTQPPIIIQQPATTTTQPPVIIEQPAPATAPPATTAETSGTRDAAIQSEIDKRMAEDAALSTLGVTATVLDGKVTLIGTVETQALKNQVERMVKAVKGVRSVDNQVIVSAG